MRAAALRLAQIRLASGDVTRGLADLEQLSAQDSTKIQADLALYATHLRKREYDKALAAVAAIEKKQPGNALNAELRGNVYLARYDLKEARKHFAKALELEPKRLSSARSLAIIDLQEGKAADARARYEKIIAAEPKNEQPLIALAEILALSGAPAAEVKSVLDRAVAANGSVGRPAPRAGRALPPHRRQQGARSRRPARPRPRFRTSRASSRRYGAMQLAGGEAAQARDTFTRLTQLVPQSPAPWLRVSEAHIAARDLRVGAGCATQGAGDPAGLRAGAGGAGDDVPDLRQARRGDRRSAPAAARAAEGGHRLRARGGAPRRAEEVRRGDSADARGDRATALARRSRRGNTRCSSRRAARADANAFADRWIKEHPKDAGFLALVGQQRQATKDNAGATAAYRAALEIEPDNVVVLNNLAWLLNEQGRPEARDLAERAYRLAPLNASVVDTLGTVLLKQGDTARGVALLRQATNLAPQDPRAAPESRARARQERRQGRCAAGARAAREPRSACAR